MKIKLLKVILLVVISVFAVNASSFAVNKAQLDEFYQKANDQYKKGDYKVAAAKYEQILEEGYSSGPLYFNMANAYFKDGQLGMAILNYKRALRLLPRDADLRANYRFAKANIKGKIYPEKGIWAWTPLKAYSQSATINEITLISSGFYLMTLVCVLLIAFRAQLRGYLISAGCLFLVLAVVNSAILVHQINVYQKEAVVVTPDLEARFGPFESETKFFTLQEGMPVVVLRTKDQWKKVRRSDGKTGWVPYEDVKML